MALRTPIPRKVKLIVLDPRAVVHQLSDAETQQLLDAIRLKYPRLYQKMVAMSFWVLPQAARVEERNESWFVRLIRGSERSWAGQRDRAHAELHRLTLQLRIAYREIDRLRPNSFTNAAAPPSRPIVARAGTA